uniref:protein LURP-one-related 15-like n=1 Tax=Erigeron canadensis TaxID=72917 RepID=UPI001CB9066B|nr:protein LURP-one-related 15-like [Erigeron canadensis]
MFQFKSKLCVNVYLGNKKSSCNTDFQIKGKWSKKCCSIHMGDSKTPISQTNIKDEKSNLMVVTINPNVDYAFVVALIAIVDAMNSSEIEVAKTVKAKGTERMIDCMCEMLCGCV